MSFTEFIEKSKRELAQLEWRRFLPLFLFIIIFDQASKHYFDSILNYNSPVEVVGDTVRLTLHYNKGIAFGLRLFENQSVFVFFSLLVCIFIFFYILTLELNTKPKLIILALVIGGAIGNIIDRAFLHQVIDFIDVDIPDIEIPAFTILNFTYEGLYMPRWPIFNIADSAISIGMVLIISLLTFTKKKMAPNEASNEE